MNKKGKLASALIFIFMVSLFPLIFIFSDKAVFSTVENRTLQKMPSLSFASLSDKSFMSDMEGYLSDHFPFRINWVKGKISTDRLMGKDDINGVFITSERILEHQNETDYSDIELSVDAINRFSDYYNTNVYAIIAPTSSGIYEDTLPNYIPKGNQKETIERIYSDFSDSVTAIDIFNCLYNNKDDYIYYRNDHHWTTYGAYLAYNYAGKYIGYEALDISDYEIKTVCDNFRGTFYSKCFCDDIKADSIYIYECKKGKNISEVIMNDGNAESTSDDIYFYEYLDGNDKYCVFLGENRAYTNIKTNVDNNRKILVIKDSYANSFVPFLTQNYSEISVIDLRYVKNSMEDFVNPDEYDDTLFLYNESTFSEDKNIKMVGFINE